MTAKIFLLSFLINKIQLFLTQSLKKKIKEIVKFYQIKNLLTKILTNTQLKRIKKRKTINQSTKKKNQTPRYVLTSRRNN